MPSKTTTLHIIPATIEHLKEVQRLNKLLFIKEHREYDKRLNLKWTFGKIGTAYYKKRITEKDGCVFIAKYNNVIVGYLCGGISKNYPYRHISKSAELENMLVLESQRSLGIGSALFAAFKKWCKKQGAEIMTVHVSAKNTKGIAFYKKNRFKEYTLILEQEL